MTAGSLLALYEMFTDATDEVRVRTAVAMARKAHLGQHRQYSLEDYVEHPIRVATSVARAGGSVDMVIAAVLHDTLEDTNLSYDEIRNTLGAPVARNVSFVTKNDGEDYLLYVQRAFNHPEARLIKRADILDNLSTLPFGDRRWKRYIDALRILSGETEIEVRLASSAPGRD